ncbi:MAG TPA: DegV family protein, partial [Peptostreptococcaceae bacterium]|nr:DegV family protein [Peptostreptococcaceae bacterium]
MSNIKVVCDSLSDIPKTLIDEYDIDVVPLTIIIEGKEYRDGVDISINEFYKKLRTEKVIPKTSQATYMQFKEVFDKHIKDGKTILYVGGSSAASGTYQSGIMAKNDIDGDIYTFDTMNFSYGSGMQVVQAAKMAKEGKNIEDILKQLQIMKDKMDVIFSVDTLEYLQKGGRISSTKAAIGTMLNIKPILEVRDGLVTNIAQVRGKKNVISKMVELVKERGGTNLSDKTIG